MKKYLNNRKTTEITCDLCGEPCIKPNSEIIRSTKLNRKLFCSIKCCNENKKSMLTPFRYYIKNSSKRSKLFTITLQDLKDQWDYQKGICPYTGYPMILNSLNPDLKSLNRMYLASLDRIDSNLGYTKNNIEFVCLPINYLKHQFSKVDTNNFLKNLKLP